MVICTTVIPFKHKINNNYVISHKVGYRQLIAYFNPPDKTVAPMNERYTQRVNSKFNEFLINPELEGSRAACRTRISPAR